MSTNEAALKLARETYRQYGERKALEAGSAVDKAWGLKVLAGEADGSHGVQIALAAILEVTERAAKHALAIRTGYERNGVNADPIATVATALRNLEHLS